jgi:hypothetical protein
MSYTASIGCRTSCRAQNSSVVLPLILVSVPMDRSEFSPLVILLVKKNSSSSGIRRSDRRVVTCVERMSNRLNGSRATGDSVATFVRQSDR